MHVCIVWHDGRKQTVSYPKFLVEIDQGYPLKDGETVDHINRDFTDNRLENLRVVSLSKNASDDALRLKSQKFNCPWCETSIVADGKKLHDIYHNRLKGKAGPFCSKSCAGKYGKAIQTNKIEKLKVVVPIRQYYRRDKN